MHMEIYEGKNTFFLMQLINNPFV